MSPQPLYLCSINGAVVLSTDPKMKQFGQIGGKPIGYLHCSEQPTSGVVSRTVAGVFGTALPLALGLAYDFRQIGCPAPEFLCGAALLSVGGGLLSAATTHTAGDSFIRGALLGTATRYVLRTEGANLANVYNGTAEAINAMPSKVSSFISQNAPWCTRATISDYAPWMDTAIDNIGTGLGHVRESISLMGGTIVDGTRTAWDALTKASVK